MLEQSFKFVQSYGLYFEDNFEHTFIYVCNYVFSYLLSVL